MRKQGTAAYRRQNSCPSASSRELCAWTAQPSESRVFRRNCSLRAQCTSFPCPEKRIYAFGSCRTRFLFPLRSLPPPPRKSAAQARRAPGLHGAMLRSGKQARRANLTAQLRRFCSRRHLLSRCADEEAIDIRRESFMPSLADYAGFIPADDAKTQPSSLGRSRHRPGRSPCGGRSRSG